MPYKVLQTGFVMSVLNLPPPSWMTEDLVLLEEQARRFIATEYVPHLDTWNEQGMYGREVWTKAGSAGLLCPAIPEEYGGAGGSFAHEAVIGRELSLAGFDSFGAPLHSGTVAPYILHYGTDEQKRRWLPKLLTGELGLASADTSELFFEDVKLPAESLLGSDEGQGFVQLMNDLPRERLIVAVHAQAMLERALAVTIEYVKQRAAFGKKLIEFQNTQFGLAECKAEATIARVFHDHCIERYLTGTLDTVTASMAKYWLTDLQGKIIDRCLQFFGGYGYMDEFPISRMYRDARVTRIYAGTNEIMKLLIARSL